MELREERPEEGVVCDRNGVASAVAYVAEPGVWEGGFGQGGIHAAEVEGAGAAVAADEVAVAAARGTVVVVVVLERKLSQHGMVVAMRMHAVHVRDVVLLISANAGGERSGASAAESRLAMWPASSRLRMHPVRAHF